MGGGALAKQLVTFGNVTPLDVKRFLTPYRRSNLSVLIGIPQTWMASDASLAGEQGMRLIKKLLELTEPAYDFIVFDLGQTYNHPVHLTALQQADLIFLVVNSTVTSLYAGHKALGALRQAGLALLSADDVEDIYILGPHEVTVITADGQRQPVGLDSGDQERLMNLARRALAQDGKRVDFAHPFADARLRDGSRLHLAWRDARPRCSIRSTRLTCPSPPTSSSRPVRCWPWRRRSWATSCCAPSRELCWVA